TGPTITALQQITTNPRNIVVQALNVTFSEPIAPATFDYNDISLTLNGGSNLVTAAVGVIPVNSTNFMITNISSVQGYAGTYTLTVNAGGVSDLAGNPGSGATNESWLMVLGIPPSPTNLHILPDLGISPTDGLTSTNSLTLSGTVGATNLAVQVFDATTGSPLGPANVTGTNFDIALAFTTEGLHHLQANAVDPAGNVSLATFLDVFLDMIPPTAIIQPVANPSYFPVSTIPVTLSKGIITNTISATNFLVTLNGTNRFTPTLTYISSNQFLLGNLTAFTTPLGNYQVSLFLNGIQDYAGNMSANVVSMNWVHAPYAPPVITPVANLNVTPNTAVNVHIQATDPNGYQLTYRLGSGAPAGASVAAGSGIFTWTPTCQQGTTTNLITIWAIDSASTPLSNSVSFTITVSTCIQFQAGSTVMQAGTTSSVPVSLVSSASLTNLSFGLVCPEQHRHQLRPDPKQQRFADSIQSGRDQRTHVAGPNPAGIDWLHRASGPVRVPAAGSDQHYRRGNGRHYGWKRLGSTGPRGAHRIPTAFGSRPLGEKQPDLDPVRKSRFQLHDSVGHKHARDILGARLACSHDEHRGGIYRSRRERRDRVL